jgi:hypothetical protein
MSGVAATGLPLPVLIPSNLVWDLIKPVSIFAFNFANLLINNKIVDQTRECLYSEPVS